MSNMIEAMEQTQSASDAGESAKGVLFVVERDLFREHGAEKADAIVTSSIVVRRIKKGFVTSESLRIDADTGEFVAPDGSRAAITLGGKGRPSVKVGDKSYSYSVGADVADKTAVTYRAGLLKALKKGMILTEETQWNEVSGFQTPEEIEAALKAAEEAEESGDDEKADSAQVRCEKALGVLEKNILDVPGQDVLESLLARIAALHTLGQSGLIPKAA